MRAVVAAFALVAAAVGITLAVTSGGSRKLVPGAGNRSGTARSLSDATLVHAHREGDARAFDELVRRYKDRMYTVMYRLLGNHEEALEASQDTFVRAYQGLATFRGDAAFSTWLYRIALNVGRNRLRDGARKGRDQSTSLEALDDCVLGRVGEDVEELVRLDADSASA